MKNYALLRALIRVILESKTPRVSDLSQEDIILVIEDILGRVWREVRDELVVDRQVRCQNKEVIDTVRKVQVADECAHEPRLAYTGGKRKAERRKLTLKV